MIGGFQPRAFQPAFQQSGSDGAGRRTRRHPQRYIVRVDGQEFVCYSREEAMQILARVREAAQLFSIEQAQRNADAAIVANVPIAKLEQPKIEVNTRELRAAVSETRREISVAYRKAAIDAELRLMFELDKRRDDDEDSLLLLM